MREERQAGRQAGSMTMTAIQLEVSMSACPDCDEPMIWGGMDWHPHSDRQHAVTRARLTRYAARLLRERASVLAGHRITVRFTVASAWFECACGERGQTWPWSEYARGEAHDHLAAGLA